MFNSSDKKILITGGAGFIGSNLAFRLANTGAKIFVIDSMSPIYDSKMAELRRQNLLLNSNIEFIQQDLSKVSSNGLYEIFSDKDIIFHLAAMPGVSQSIANPDKYKINNIDLFNRIMQIATKIRPELFFFASSSSVYGENSKERGLKEEEAHGNNLKSYYAYSKWQNEIAANTVSKLIPYPMIALRFFTVFGPWGRPDMAYWKFAQKIEQSQVIDLFGNEGGKRNFTFIDDVIRILLKLMKHEGFKGYNVLNIATSDPKSPFELAKAIASNMPKSELKTRFIPRPNYDVATTWADQTKLEKLIGPLESTNFDKAVKSFVDWYSDQTREIRLNFRS